jgi:hypothetical protein
MSHFLDMRHLLLTVNEGCDKKMAKRRQDATNDGMRRNSRHGELGEGQRRDFSVQQAVTRSSNRHGDEGVWRRPRWDEQQ